MKHVHLIGIGGTGLSAIAAVLAEQGYSVSGSDRVLSPLARALQQAGIQVMEGHRTENIAGADLVVRSSAIPDDNPEVQAARAAGIPVYKRSDFLGTLLAGRQVVAVAGTHGKTTTTAMIAWMLTVLGQEPGFIAGSTLQNLGTNARAGSGPLFVIEADEYDRMFLGLTPWAAVVTNLEHDHPDCYPTAQDYQAAFLEFARLVTPGGLLLACVDDPGAARLLADAAAANGPRTRLTYGLAAEEGWSAADVAVNDLGGYDFSLLRARQPLVRASLSVPGLHNVRNALAALAIAGQLGLPLEDAASALGAFQGTGRRFELRGEVGGVAVVDDYAHHPTEIRATLAAARARFASRRLWAVWQPHTYSRTRTLFGEFAGAFNDADQVLVTEIYAARETAGAFSAAEVVERMPHPQARFVSSLAEATQALLNEVRPGDVVLILSAGDADQIGTQVLDTLRERMGNHA